MDGLEQQVIALAAAVQSVVLVMDVARRGRADTDEVQVCLQGLLRPYRPNLVTLYGGARQLRTGLQTLAQQLEHPKDRDLTRHLLVLMQLETRLRKQPQRLQGIATGLEHARRQVEFFDGAGPATYRTLSALYSEHVSELRPKVMVVGERGYLEQAQNAELIRALLLAALRALSLWRQQGGRRFHLLLMRRRLVAVARELLGEG